MTFIGKLCVMLNLILSLLLGGLAFALFTTRVDWSDKAGKQGEPDGVVFTLSKQLKKDSQSAEAAGSSWLVARKALTDAEKDRSVVRPRYAQELQHLLTGAKAGSPAREVEIDLRPIDPADKTGKLPNPRRWLALVDPATRFPVLKPAEHNGKELESRASYLRQIEGKLKEGLTVEGNLFNHYVGDIVATDKLVGNADYDAADPKVGTRKGTDPGIIRLLFDDADKREGLEEEMRLVESQDVNTQIDGQAVKRSYASVEDRIKELEDYLRKRGLSFTPWQEKTTKKD